MADLAGEVTELLQQLIRNACVNDGAEDSGQEHRNADLLRSYLDGPELEHETFEPLPGRESLVVRVEGSDPDAPSLMLMAHTDVVPADPDAWARDPFGGELVDGVVWGRGAIDMHNLTSSMAVALRHLVDEGFRPRGDLVFLAVADEEAGGTWGAKWLVEHEPDAVRTDHVLTEVGGARLPFGSDDEPKLAVAVAEKGAFWGTITVGGVPGHGSMPLRTDNALITGAEIVRRIAEYRPPARVVDVWQRFVDGIELPAELADAATDPDRVYELCEQLPDIGMARFLHACTHTTFAPTMMDAGVKTNVIPDHAAIDFDIRALPGVSSDDVVGMIHEALGDLAGRVEIELRHADEASVSPIDTPLWDALARHAPTFVPGAVTVPYMLPAATDSRFLRQLGATCYGFGLYTDWVTFGEYQQLFHGIDERIDVESLRLTTELWLAVVRDLLG